MSVLKQKILDRTVTLGVVGLGYVGLPLAVEKAKAGFQVIGFDVQDQKVEMVNRGHNYIGDVVDSDLEKIVKEGYLRATTDFATTAEKISTIVIAMIVIATTGKKIWEE